MRLILFLVALAIASPASAWIARNALIVEPTGSDSFHIPYRGKSSVRAFWCAAGDYVIRELHLPADTEIYRTSRPPRRAGQGISFSLSPAEATRPGLAILAGGPGLTASFARALCEEPRLIEDE